MSAEGDPGLIAKILGGVSAALTAIATWAWAHTHKRIDEKADKEMLVALTTEMRDKLSAAEFEGYVKATERRFDEIGSELTTQRGHITKIFDKLEDMNRRAEDRAMRLLEAINGGKK